MKTLRYLLLALASACLLSSCAESVDVPGEVVVKQYIPPSTSYGWINGKWAATSTSEEYILVVRYDGQAGRCSASTWRWSQLQVGDKCTVREGLLGGEVLDQ